MRKQSNEGGELSTFQNDARRSNAAERRWSDDTNDTNYVQVHNPVLEVRQNIDIFSFHKNY